MLKTAASVESAVDGTPDDSDGKEVQKDNEFDIDFDIPLPHGGFVYFFTHDVSLRGLPDDMAKACCFEFAVDLDGGVMTMADRRNIDEKRPLHTLLRSGQASVRDVERLLKKQPKEASTRNSKKRLPIEEALRAKYVGSALVHGEVWRQERRRKLQIVKAIMNAYPAGLREHSGWNGSLPLHVAARNGCGLPVLSEVMRAHPDAIKTPDTSKDSMPLHVALRHHLADKNMDSFLALFSAYPDAAKHADSTGQYPIHLALRNNAPLACAMVVLEAYPKAVAVKCKRINGQYPLHCLLLENHNRPYVGEEMAEACPARTLSRLDMCGAHS